MVSRLPSLVLCMGAGLTTFHKVFLCLTAHQVSPLGSHWSSCPFCARLSLTALALVCLLVRHDRMFRCSPRVICEM